jgi:YD repeat-containing protein
MPPAAKHFDPLVGIDVHIIQPPGPVPPVPVPHPYTGMLMDPCDYAPVIGGTVKVGGLQRAQAGTGGVSIPKHIPIGGVFVKPPADESEMFMGSSTVAADGDAFSYLGLPALSCQCVGMPPIPRKKGSTPKTFVLPTTVCLSIPLPVSVGGSPTVSLMALGMKAGLAALGALAKKVKKARKAKKAKGANGAKCTGADPVDIITGAVYDDVIDARAAAPRMFQWSRHYTTERAKERGVLGFGFRHGYAHVLRTDVQAVTYSPPSGHDVAFEPLAKVGEQCVRFGFVLTRIDVRHYELRDRERPRMIFERLAGIDRARLVKIDDGRRWIDLRYDAVELERLVAVRESGPEGASEYAIEHDTAGRIVAVHEQRSTGRTRIAAYAYDKRGDLFAALDAAGGERRYGYDDRHRWISRTDPTGTGGFTYTWAYDAAGRCVLADSQDGLWRTQFAYDAAKRTTTVIEPSGGTYLYEYDEQGTLSKRTDPEGGVLSREVDADDGRVLVEIDSGGRAMRWLYDERGGHVARADRFGHRFPPEVEAPKLPDPLAHHMPETPRAWWLGTREGPRQPQGAIAASLPTAIAAACPLQPQAPERWTVEHDGLGRPIREIDAQGRTRVLVRDRAGVVTQRTDRDGCTTRTKTVSWNLVGTTLDGLGHATRMSYNATEQLTELVDPKGGTSRFGYDAKDRLVSITRHGRVRETYHYDAGDQLVEKRDGAGNVLLTLTYGADTLLATRTLASGEQQRFAHDARGAVTEASTDLHDVRMASREDGGPLFDRRDGVGVEHVWVGARVRRTHVLGRFVTRYHHDRTGTTTITDPTGTVHRLRHGAEGVVVREHAPGRRELSRFSAEGRCEARIGWSVDHADAGPEWSRRWVYSAEGDLLEAHDGACTRFTIDAAHRLVASDGPHGHADFVLDAAGNVEQKPGLVGVVLDEGNRLRFANGETFGYDLRNSITTRTAVDGAQTTYGYDSLDRLVRIDDADPRGPWTAT